MHCDTGQLRYRDLAPARADSPALRNPGYGLRSLFGPVWFEGAFCAIPRAIGPTGRLLRALVAQLRRLAIRATDVPSTELTDAPHRGTQSIR